MRNEIAGSLVIAACFLSQAAASSQPSMKGPKQAEGPPAWVQRLAEEPRRPQFQRMEEPRRPQSKQTAPVRFAEEPRRPQRDQAIRLAEEPRRPQHNRLADSTVGAA